MSKPWVRLVATAAIVAAAACATDTTAPYRGGEFAGLTGRLRLSVVVKTPEGTRSSAYSAPFETEVRNGIGLARLDSKWRTLSLDASEPPVQDCAENCDGSSGSGGGGGAKIFDMQHVIDSLRLTPDSVVHNPLLDEYGPSIPVALTHGTAAAVSPGEQVMRSGALDSTVTYRVAFTKASASEPVSRITGYRNDTLAMTVDYQWREDGEGWLLTRMTGKTFGSAGELLATVNIEVDSVIRYATAPAPADLVGAVARIVAGAAGVLAPQDAVAQVRSCIGEGAWLAFNVAAATVTTAITTATAGAGAPTMVLAFTSMGVALFAYASCKEGQREDQRSAEEERQREEEQERRLRELERRLKELEEENKKPPTGNP